MKKVMMLLRLLILVILLFLALWGFLKWTEVSTKETFVSDPPPGYRDPSAGQLLMAAFGDLPETERAMATESHQQSQVDLTQSITEYNQRTDPQTARPLVVTQQTNQFEEQVRPQAIPTTPLWQQLRQQRQSTPQRPTSRPAPRIVSTRPQVPPGPDDRTIQYTLMLSELESNAYDECFIDNCEPVQDYIKESCKKFAPECTIQELQNIENCMMSYQDRCSEKEVEECRQYCRNEWSSRSARTQLNQDEFMKSNDRLTSETGTTVLVLRDNGELEIYYNRELVWKSNTNRSEIGGGSDKGPFMLKMHGNGDLVLSNGLGLEVWHSNTWLDTLGAGFINAPYILKVGNGYMYIENKSKQIIWRNNSS
jgi:hypothetical protein